MLWSVHIDIVAYQLTIVLVGCEHVSLDTVLASLCGESTYHIISLETVYLKNGDVVGFEDILDDGY